MNYDELATRLRDEWQKNKRRLCEEAADAIEALQREQIKASGEAAIAETQVKDLREQIEALQREVADHAEWAKAQIINPESDGMLNLITEKVKLRQQLTVVAECERVMWEALKIIANYRWHNEDCDQFNVSQIANKALAECAEVGK